VFAREVLTDLKAQLPRLAQNGSSDHAGPSDRVFPEWRRGHRDDKASR
jgi:hypothetical protein